MVEEKKRVDLKGEEVVEGEENGGVREMGFLCPFTSMGSPTQRKIKELYHQLLQSCESKELTLAQVGEFTKCLAQTKEELEDKAEAIKRKLSIKKALLSKADRSSIDRLRQQLFNLEKQQMRLEEDACVYNWLQDQLQLSPACRKMLEVCADLELKTKSSKPLKSTEPDEFADMSFEELLAQEEGFILAEKLEIKKVHKMMTCLLSVLVETLRKFFFLSFFFFFFFSFFGLQGKLVNPAHDEP